MRYKAVTAFRPFVLLLRGFAVGSADAAYEVIISPVNWMVNLTAEEIARIFHARRIGRARWRAVCPIHGGKHSGPLSIATSKPGVRAIVFVCFGGCDVRAILATAGLTLSDLYEDAKPDRAALALADKMRAQEERKRQDRRRKERAAIDRARKWEACMKAMGLLLSMRPEDGKLASLFHWACEQTRDLPPVGLFDGDTDLRGLFPVTHPLNGITCQDVGRQVGRYLRLPNE